MPIRKETLADRFAHGYGLVKKSIVYPISLMLIVFFWYLTNKIFGLDPGLVNLLTFLSVEASLATSLVQRDQAKQEDMMMVMLKSIKHTLEALKSETRDQQSGVHQSSGEYPRSSGMDTGTVGASNRLVPTTKEPE